MKIIKQGTIKRTRYLLLDRIELNGFYKVVKHHASGKVTELFKDTSLIGASNFFDRIFL